MFLRMVLLNLVKHRRRTVLIVFAIMVSVLVMEVMAGMFEGMRVNFFRNLTRESGHVQIHAQGYPERLNPFSLEYRIPRYDTVIAEVLTIPGVLDAEPVLNFGALLEHRGRDLTLSGVGLRETTRFYRDVRDGIVEGTFPAGLQDGVVLSTATARLLRLNHGDPVNVIVEDSTGSPYYRQFPVTGLFETPSPERDENTFFISHGAAQELVYLEGETIEIRIRLRRAEDAEAFRDRAADHGSNLVIRTWRELQGGLTALLEMMNFFVLIMNLFVIIVVAGVITNAILMNVFERMRVLGTMRAIGLKRRTAGAMILVEGIIQGVLGSILGLTVGIPIVLYFTVNGIDWGGISEAFGMGSAYYYFGYSPLNSLYSALGGILVATGGSLYAARAGMRLTIMEALHHV